MLQGVENNKLEFDEEIINNTIKGHFKQEINTADLIEQYFNK